MQTDAKKTYYADSYSADHWAMKPISLENAHAVALFSSQASEYAFLLNPTDKRGYRSIVRLINNAKMESTFNRAYTLEEKRGLHALLCLISHVYENIVPVAQTVVAGNNAQQFDAENELVRLGTKEEPCLLHGHVFGRGDPRREYVPGVPLGGPRPSLPFDLRAQHSQEPGNESKTAWKPEEREKVIACLRKEISASAEEFRKEGFSLRISSSLKSVSSSGEKYCDIYLIKHGETDLNQMERLQGQADIALNLKGKEQAVELQDKLKAIAFAAAFSSDLQRAKLTAQIVLGEKNIKIIETRELRERALGFWEGRLAKDLRAKLANLRISTCTVNQENYLAYKWDKNVESYAEAFQRLETFLRREAISYLGASLLLSSHGGVLRSVLYRLHFCPGKHWEVSHCAYLRLRMNEQGEISLVEKEGVSLQEEVSLPF